MVVLIVSLVGTRLRQQMVVNFQDEIRRELNLARELLRDRGDVAPDSVARFLTARIDYRTTLIDRDGIVLGDSRVPEARVPEMENHAGRPEVRGALQGSLTFSERTSGTIGVRLLYGALPARLGERPVVLRIAAPLEDIDATVGRLQRAVAVTGLVAMALALVLAYLLSRAFASPLVTLAERAGQLASGDFSQRAPRSTRVAELDELSVAFNRLADELQVRLAELGHERDEMQTLIDCMAEGVIALTEDARVLRTNRAARTLLAIPEPATFAPVGTIVRQPELRELLEESVVTAVQAREVVLGERHLVVSSRMLDQGGAVTTFLDITELRRMEQVRRDFVANASHELKTPLTSMRGFAETLLEDEPPERLKREFLTSIRNNTIRLQRLVDDLLDLSKLESDRWEPTREEVPVHVAAAEVWEELASRAARRDIRFEILGEGWVYADEQGLHQILENLLDNALRYTAENGRITVSVHPKATHVEVAVSDTGVGIPSRALPRIFERFYRVDAARDREMGGTGLGLSIVRHLVSGMGGHVEAESELGHGTTIRFTLPRSRERPGAV